MTHVVVVGGGPAGLAAAFRLTRASADDISAHVLERAPATGGLAAGFQRGPFTLDFGPHRLHRATDPVVLDDLRQLLGDQLLLKQRRGRIRLRGRSLPYPVGPRTVLGLGLPTAARLMWGALTAHHAAAESSYESALVASLGRPLYELFYGPYAEKVWGRPGSSIAADQAERRVNQRGLADLARQALGRGEGRQFYYPRGGFGQIPAAYASALARTPTARVDCSVSVERVTWDGQRTVSGVDYARGADAAASARVDHLVWSAPIGELMRRLDPAPPADIAAAVEDLAYRAVVLCYVVLDRSHVGDVDTYYFPEARYPFNRVIEQKNFSDTMAPLEQTVLGMDIACDPHGPVFGQPDDELRRWLVPILEGAGLVRPHEVIEVFSRRFRAAYPIYDMDYRVRLERVQRWLERLENVWLVGRQGLYLHNNTHHSLLMGYRVADAIRAGRREVWRDEVAEFQTLRVAD